MTYLVRKPIRNLEKAMHRNFDNTVKTSARCNLPKTDIIEKDEVLHFYIEMPGISKENISLNVNDDNILTVKGELENDVLENKTILKRERNCNDYVRYLALPDDIDKENIKAKLSNGVLQLDVYKKQPVMPKEIEISIN